MGADWTDAFDEDIALNSFCGVIGQVRSTVAQSAPTRACDPHVWTSGKDACILCGQSWSELYEVVRTREHGMLTFRIDER